VRLAIPRRVYTRNHLAYVADAVTYVAGCGRAIGGMRITYQPAAMRHFTARFAWLRPEPEDGEDSTGVAETESAHRELAGQSC
jgi:hypothetical protein